MKWREIKVTFEAPVPALARDLISEIFYDLGAGGVVVEDPDEVPEGDWAPGEAGRCEHHAVGAYFPLDEGFAERRRRLRRRLTDLEVRQGLRSRTTQRDLDEEDWAESWKAHFHTERITSRLTVRPSWRSHDPRPGEIVLEIDPGMAFGTGTHPTTALCLAWLDTHLVPGTDFLDVGTGSGILMVAAARLGARRVTGIDSDPLAVQVAGENLRRNRIEPDRARVQVGDLLTGLPGRFHFVTANILSPVILRLLDGIWDRLAPGGLFVCSGIVRENAPEVERKMRARGLELLPTRTREEWVAPAGRKPGSTDNA